MDVGLGRVELQGLVYYQQYRRCGRRGCKCQRGLGHGPYWYCRMETGRVRYVGKELSRSVQVACQARDAARSRLRMAMETKHAQYQALVTLWRNGVVSRRERRILAGLGFADCLLGEEGDDG